MLTNDNNISPVILTACRKEISSATFSHVLTAGNKHYLHSEELAIKTQLIPVFLTKLQFPVYFIGIFTKFLV